MLSSHNSLAKGRENVAYVDTSDIKWTANLLNVCKMKYELAHTCQCYWSCMTKMYKHTKRRLFDGKRKRDLHVGLRSGRTGGGRAAGRVVECLVTGTWAKWEVYLITLGTHVPNVHPQLLCTARSAKLQKTESILSCPRTQ